MADYCGKHTRYMEIFCGKMLKHVGFRKNIFFTPLPARKYLVSRFYVSVKKMKEDTRGYKKKVAGIHHIGLSCSTWQLGNPTRRGR